MHVSLHAGWLLRRANSILLRFCNQHKHRSFLGALESTLWMAAAPFFDQAASLSAQIPSGGCDFELPREFVSARSFRIPRWGLGLSLGFIPSFSGNLPYVLLCAHGRWPAPFISRHFKQTLLLRWFHGGWLQWPCLSVCFVLHAYMPVVGQDAFLRALVFSPSQLHHSAAHLGPRVCDWNLTGRIPHSQLPASNTAWSLYPGWDS